MSRSVVIRATPPWLRGSGSSRWRKRVISGACRSDRRANGERSEPPPCSAPADHDPTFTAVADFYRLLDQEEGKRVELMLDRGGRLIVKQVEIAVLR